MPLHTSRSPRWRESGSYCGCCRVALLVCAIFKIKKGGVVTMRNMRTMWLTIPTVFCILSFYYMFSLLGSVGLYRFHTELSSVRSFRFHTDELWHNIDISVHLLIVWFLLSAVVSEWGPFVQVRYIRSNWSQQVKLCFLVLTSFITSLTLMKFQRSAIGIRESNTIRLWGNMPKIASVPKAIVFTV